MNDFARRLELLFEGPLPEVDTAALFGALVKGALEPLQIAALLTALRVRGEQPAEIAGAVRALRAAAAPFPRPTGVFVDACGTGGDGHHTVNISTAVALVVAAAGVRVAKHGNRSVSSCCGSADVLEACGVRLDLPAPRARQCLDELGICFLFAPQYHTGLRHVMPVRRALGVRTVFNLLGPLVNPALPPRQLVGVYDACWCAPVAETLGRVGCERALVVHGSGLDEVALHGPTTGVLLDGGRIRPFHLVPEDVGLSRQPLSALAGGDPAHNAAWLEGLLGGQGTPAHRDVVALNAAVVLWLADATPDLIAGVARSREILRGGAALGVLQRWIRLCAELDDSVPIDNAGGPGDACDAGVIQGTGGVRETGGAPGDGGTPDAGSARGIGP
jgi:anthranilate phosphoribosyltransferase